MTQMPDTITSVQNPLIKETAKLKQKKAREESGLLLVETRHPIEEALKAKLTLKHVFTLENMAGDIQLPIKPVTVVENVMQKMATTDSAPPCIAVVERPRYDAEVLLKSGTPFILLLDGLQDPGNVGTLIRSAVAFGATAILATDNTVDAYSPKVIRASAGLVFRIPVVTGNEALALLSQQKWPVYYATQSQTATPYRQVDYSIPSALLLGSEGTGIRPELQTKLSLTPITVGMAPGVDSLNVAVSGSIILAEAHHQRISSRAT